MLATEMTGIEVAGDTEVKVIEWVSDGTSFCIGFTGTGTYSAEFKLYVVEYDVAGTEIAAKGQYLFQTSPYNRTAYLVDRAFTVPAGHRVRLTVQHDAETVQTFYGTILGGAY